MAEITWSDASGIYLTDTNYIDSDTVVAISEFKEISNVDAIPPILIGENNSESITFEMNRYKDAIDLSALQIQILFQVGLELSAKSAYNVKVSTDKIRFMWIIDDDVTQLPVVPFSILVTGTINTKPFVWKSLPSSLKLKLSLNQNDIKPIKSNSWYTDFTLKMQQYIEQNRGIKEETLAIKTATETIKADTQKIKEDVQGLYDDLDAQIANVTNSASDMAEVIDARSTYTTLKNRLNAIDTTTNQLKETKASKNETFSMANMGQDIREAMTGGSVAVIGRESVNNETILNNSVSAKKTTFLTSENLFDGQYLHGFYLTGNETAKYIKKDSNYYLIALDVEPSTAYSFLMPSNIGVEDGNYWFKVFSSKSTKKQILDTIPIDGTNLALDGSLCWTNTTSTYVGGVQLTTGVNDKSVFVLISKYKQPYVEIRKGTYTTALYSSFKEAFKPTGIDVYTRAEVDSITDRSLYEVEKIDSKTIRIWQKGKKGYIKYTYYEHIDSSIGNDVWRLKDIYLCDNNKGNPIVISDYWVDQEGVLKIQGQTDYSGGVHGDEIGTYFRIYIDGIAKDITSITSPIKCNEIKFIVKSNINKQDGTTKIFEKYKQTWFDKDGVHVNNRWKPVSEVTLEHVRAILLSVDKGVISTYYDSIAFPIPMAVPSDSSGSLNDNRMIETFYSGNVLSAHVWCGERGGSTEGYRANVTDFTTRLKSYFDCYTGETVPAGKDIYCQNNFKLSC